LSVATGVAVALSSAACNNDGLTDLNKNPNSPTDAPPGPVFTRAANLAVSEFLGSGYDQYYLSVVAQQLAEVHGLSVQASTIWYFLDRRGITFKKRQRMLPSKNGKTSRPPAKPGWKSSQTSTPRA